MYISPLDYVASVLGCGVFEAVVGERCWEFSFPVETTPFATVLSWKMVVKTLLLSLCILGSSMLRDDVVPTEVIEDELDRVSGTSKKRQEELDWDLWLDTDDDCYFQMIDEPVGNFDPPQYTELAEMVFRKLNEAGFDAAKLATQEGSESELLTQALVELRMEATYDARGFVLQKLYAAVLRAKLEAPLRFRSTGSVSSAANCRVLDFDYCSLIPGFGSTEKAKEPELAKVYPRRGRRGKLVSAGGSGEAVVSREDCDKSRMLSYQLQLVGWWEEAEAPCVEETKASLDQRRTLMDLVGKTRVSTVGHYVRRWEIFRQWLLAVKGVPWPADVTHLTDFVHVLADEPCSPTVPQAWLQACNWMYTRGGFQGEDDLSRRAVLVKVVDHLTTQLGSNLRLILQAPRFPTLVIAALELFLCCQTNPPFKRIHAGSHLFRAVATLRFDDLQRIKRNSLRWIGKSVQTDLMSSKTSGPGKRIRQLPVIASSEAYLIEPHWLATWIELLQNHLPLDRDYLLDQATSDWKRSTDCMLRYPQASALTDKIMEELRVPVLGSGGWTSSEERVMPRELVGLFTEHSGRCSAPSVAVYLEPDKSVRDMLGRWSPSGSDDYARTHRAIVSALQDRIALALRSGEGAGRLLESDVVDRAGRYLRERRGLESCAVDSICKGWKDTLEKFCRQLGTVSANIITSECIPLSSLVPSLPTTEKPCKKQRARVERQARFLVTYSRKGKIARLHLIQGGCFWAHREILDSQMFEDIDETMYNRRCKFCFPTPAVTGIIHELSSDSGTDDSD